MPTVANNQPAKLTVAVGLSGGVDSSVSALTLKNQGHHVFGVFMQNWEADRDDPYCTAEQDLTDAKTIADQLDIPLFTTNFAKNYWDKVFQYCLDEFAAGRTPNPDVWCNREIKFNCLLEFALSQGADRLATGHYAQNHEENGRHHLLKSADISKDQTYFLYLLNQAQLSKSIFPVGELLKTDVRNIAKKMNFITHAKKDSTGICFIGERKFKTFLSEFLLAKPGKMETPDGKVIGHHDGIMFYTIGQRKGLQIGGRVDSDENAWYVLKKDVKHNVLIVGQGHDHPLLFSDKLQCSQLHWISGSPSNNLKQLKAKTRYRQPDQTCEITKIENDRCSVVFEHPQRAITPGQSIVFYHGDECLGGGIID